MCAATHARWREIASLWRGLSRTGGFVGGRRRSRAPSHWRYFRVPAGAPARGYIRGANLAALHSAPRARARASEAIPSCSLVATDPDGADRRAHLVHDGDGPFGVRPETAVQVFQLLAHENHGSIAGRLRARKLGAGMVGLVRPIVEVEEVASHPRLTVSGLELLLVRQESRPVCTVSAVPRPNG